jgi:hypothetical protein
VCPCMCTCLFVWHMCVIVCVRACVRVCVQMCLCLCIHKGLLVPAHLNLLIPARNKMSQKLSICVLCTCVYICTVHMCIHVDACALCTCVYTCTNVYACARVYMCTVHMCIYVYTCLCVCRGLLARTGVPESGNGHNSSASDVRHQAIMAANAAVLEQQQVDQLRLASHDKGTRDT